MDPASQLVLGGRRKSFKVPHFLPHQTGRPQRQTVDLLKQKHVGLTQRRPLASRPAPNKTHPVCVSPGVVTAEQVEDAVEARPAAARHRRVQVTSSHALRPADGFYDARVFFAVTDCTAFILHVKFLTKLLTPCCRSRPRFSADINRRIHDSGHSCVKEKRERENRI